MVPELRVGLVELGGEYSTPCEVCGKNAVLYVLDSEENTLAYCCSLHLGPKIEQVLLSYI